MHTFLTRNKEPESMDNPVVEQSMLKEVFEDINRSNRILGGNKITLDGVSKLVQAHPQESYTIVDMGCGDGSLLRKVVLWARKQNIKIKCFGVDLSEKGLSIARNQSLNFPEIHYLKQDILTLERADLQCDILLCTLTMHHFSDEEIPNFLKHFVQLASIGIVINDLQRSIAAYYLFKLFSVIFIRTKIAKEDGLISIKSGFTKPELLAFARDIPSMKHQIQWRWAFRYVWVMRTNRLIKVYE